MANTPYTYNLQYNCNQIDDRFDENNRLSINGNLSGMVYFNAFVPNGVSKVTFNYSFKPIT